VRVNTKEGCPGSRALPCMGKAARSISMARRPVWRALGPRSNPQNGQREVQRPWAVPDARHAQGWLAHPCAAPARMGPRGGERNAPPRPRIPPIRQTSITNVSAHAPIRHSFSNTLCPSWSPGPPPRRYHPPNTCLVYSACEGPEHAQGPRDAALIARQEPLVKATACVSADLLRRRTPALDSQSKPESQEA
jgi:hypothetical protein